MNTVLSDQQPRVSFLHCEELRVLQIRRKDSSLAFFIFVSSSLDPSRRTFSARGGRECVRTHCTPLPTRLYFVFNEKAGEKSRGQSRGRPRTIMTDGTVNTLSGAVTQTDYIDI